MNRYKEIPKPFLYFILPFALLAILTVCLSFRISAPDGALRTSQKYLEEKIPGNEWQVSKMMKVGAGLSKKWRIELTSSGKNGRMAQANLIVNRWRPGHLVGKFVMAFGPPQILDGEWDSSMYLDSLSAKIPLQGYLIGAVIFFGLQCFWLFWVRRRGRAIRRDGVLLAFLGLGLLSTQLVLEVHPGYMAGYAIIISVIVGAVFGGGPINGRS